VLKHYLLLSLKVLLRRKFFTFISIFGISFTLLVLMVVTAMADHKFGPGKPESAQTRMLGVRYAFLSGPGNRNSNNSVGFRVLDRYARNLPGAEALTIFSRGDTVTIYRDGAKITRDFKMTDGEFWRILDFEFIEGAAYTPDDVREARPVAVINRSTRARLFGGRPAIGSSIELGDLRLRIVGVVEDVSMFRSEPYSDIWAPYTTQRSQSYRNEITGGYQTLVLASSTAALPGIREEFNRRLTQMDFGDRRQDFDTIVAPFETEFESLARNSPFGDRTSPDRQTWKLGLFFGIVVFLFVALPTVNLININISRILERASEVGVRKAFGAPASTLVTQFVVENVLLSACGGLVGLLLSAAVLRAINRSGFFPYSQLAVNLRVFVYGLLIAAAFGLISGVYPAWRMARLHPVNALKGGSGR
jgi:putative ABC transport system permease protein